VENLKMRNSFDLLEQRQVSQEFIKSGHCRQVNLLVGLILGITLILSGMVSAGETHGQGSPEQDERLVESVEESPLKPPDTTSPLKTLESFSDDMNEAYKLLLEYSPKEKIAVPFRRAVRCLNLSEVSPSVVDQVSIDAALQIKEVLDRLPTSYFAEAPDEEEAQSKKLRRWTIPETEIVIAKAEKGPRKGEFLFSPRTVDRAGEFYDYAKLLPYQSKDSKGFYELIRSLPGSLLPIRWILRLPSWAREFHFGQPLWKLISLALLVLVGLGTILGAYLWGRRWNRIHEEANWRLGSMTIAAATILVPIGIRYVMGSVVAITGSLAASVGQVLVIISYCGLAWMSVFVLNGIAEVVIRMKGLSTEDVQSQLTRFVFRIITATTIVLIGIKCAIMLGLPAYSVLTSLGIGGAAVALAARDTLANLFGSVTIMLDKPFQIGDFVKLRDCEGDVESIGFRCTRIRTFDDSLVSVPNSQVVNEIIDNMGSRTCRRVRTILQTTYDTPLERIRAFVQGITGIILSNPLTRKDRYYVAFHEFGAHSLDILVDVWLEVPDLATELSERERLFMEIFQLAETLGVEFAFPTQTLHVESLPSEDAGPENS
jgi:MscS family membrane protein